MATHYNAQHNVGYKKHPLFYGGCATYILSIRCLYSKMLLPVQQIIADYDVLYCALHYLTGWFVDGSRYIVMI